MSNNIMSQSPAALQKIADAYESNPVVRGLVQILMSPLPYGIGSAIDAALTSRIENMREERWRAFFEELAAGTRDLSEDTIQQEDFLLAYFATLKAAVNTRQKEKIRLFARLLSNAARMEQTGSETYEEFLRILEDLSLRELHILSILKRLEDVHSNLPKVMKERELAENDLQRANRFWDDFEKAVESEVGIHPDQLRAILNRLNRTGLYETIVGTYDGYYTGGRGRLTSLFKEFAAWLESKDELHRKLSGSFQSAEWLAKLHALAEEVGRKWKSGKTATETVAEMRR